MALMNLRVRQIDSESASDRGKLVKFPFWLYKRDPYWVPPLIGDRKKFLDPSQNPSFEYLKVAYFVAEAQVRPDSASSGSLTASATAVDQVVGTIAAIVNPRHNQIHQDRVGFFGLFEIVNDYQVAEALLDSAASWLRDQGCDTIRGPATFTQLDEYGLLVDGFNFPPCILMPYNMPYYPEFVEAWGLQGAMDLYAYRFDLVEQVGGDLENLPPKLSRVVDKLRERSKARIRPIKMSDYDAEVKRIKQIYDQAWEKNWGAVPISDRELEHVAKQMKQVIDPDLALIAEVNGQPVGMCLTLPDANQVLKHMGGRLFPLGIFKALYYQRKVTWGRVWALGVLPEYRQRGLEAVMIYQIAKTGIEKGYRYMEASWILAVNTDMSRVIENLGGMLYKTYRVYEKAL